MSCSKSQICDPPFGVVSLFDMLRFYAQDFVTSAGTMGRMQQQAELYKRHPVIDGPLPDDERTLNLETANNFKEMCRAVHLTSAIDQLDRMIERFSESGECTYRAWYQMNEELH